MYYFNYTWKFIPANDIIFKLHPQIIPINFSPAIITLQLPDYLRPERLPKRRFPPLPQFIRRQSSLLVRHIHLRLNAPCATACPYSASNRTPGQALFALSPRPLRPMFKPSDTGAQGRFMVRFRWRCVYVFRAYAMRALSFHQPVRTSRSRSPAASFRRRRATS